LRWRSTLHSASQKVEGRGERKKGRVWREGRSADGLVVVDAVAAAVCSTVYTRTSDAF
jgi:hypothetical protein